MKWRAFYSRGRISLHMVSATDPKIKDAVLSILLEAKQCGVRRITRTALVKYVYLMDLWTAEETGGNTFTEVEWRFHHFGPYSDALAGSLDWLSTQPSIHREAISGKDKDYSLYGLVEWTKAPTFEALGLATDVRLKLIEAIKRYAGDLNALLNFVYFETKPMQNTLPGSILSFAGIPKLNYKTDIKAINVPVADAKKIARIKLLLARIGEQWKEGHKPGELTNPPIRDALFMQSVEDEGLEGIDLNCNASLSFHNNQEND